MTDRFKHLRSPAAPLNSPTYPALGGQDIDRKRRSLLIPDDGRGDMARCLSSSVMCSISCSMLTSIWLTTGELPGFIVRSSSWFRQAATFDDELLIGEQAVTDARIDARPAIFTGSCPCCRCGLHQTDSGTIG